MAFRSQLFFDELQLPTQIVRMALTDTNKTSNPIWSCYPISYRDFRNYLSYSHPWLLDDVTTLKPCTIVEFHQSINRTTADYKQLHAPLSWQNSPKHTPTRMTDLGCKWAKSTSNRIYLRHFNMFSVHFSKWSKTMSQDCPIWHQLCPKSTIPAWV